MNNKFSPRYPVVKSTETKSCKEYVDSFMNLIQLDPVEQRVDVQLVKNERKNRGKITKRQGIIGAIFDGLDISEIYLCKLSSDDIKMYTVEFPDIDNILPHKVCDGAHRARAIRDFKGNKFPTHKSSWIGSKYYSELTAGERAYFDNYVIRFVVFESTSPEFLGAQFNQTSQSTPLNHQEVLNARGITVPVSNPIRSLARELGEGINNTPHELYRLNAPRGGKQTAVYLTTGPQRLSYDRQVARIFYLVLNGSKPNACDDEQVEEMYNDKNITKEVVASATPKVVDCLDFILGLAKAKIKDRDGRSKLNIEEYNAIMRLYFTWQSRNQFKPRQVKYDELWQLFSKSYGQFHKNGGNYVLTLLENGKPRWSEFFVRLRTHKKVKHWNDTVEWLEFKYLNYSDLVANGILPYKQGKGSRTFNIEDVFRKWEENGRIDEADGKPLAFGDAVGAHKIAYSEGGSTTYDNLAVISRYHNTKMGSMSLDDYKQTILQQNKKH